MVENDMKELRKKVSELTEENKRYVIAVAEALFFAQNHSEVKKCDTGNSVCQSIMGRVK